MVQGGFYGAIRGVLAWCEIVLFGHVYNFGISSLIAERIDEVGYARRGANSGVARKLSFLLPWVK
jgi:hypothetical protein